MDREECVAAVDEFRAGTLEPFNREPQGAIGSLGVTPGPVLHTTGALTRVEQELYETRIRLGATLKALGRDKNASNEWHKARMMDRDNFVLRKQIWMLEHPDRFHPVIDFEWQKVQLALERAEEATRLLSNCGQDGCGISSK